MPSPSTPPRRPNISPGVVERYTHLESQVSGVAATLDGFIKDQSEYRSRAEREQTAIWAAIREQGDNLRNAIEKLSTKGQISWPMIVTTVGLILSVSGAAATVGHMLMESRIKQVEIRAEFMGRLADENHAAIKAHVVK